MISEPAPDFRSAFMKFPPRSISSHNLEWLCIPILDAVMSTQTSGSFSCLSVLEGLKWHLLAQRLCLVLVAPDKYSLIKLWPGSSEASLWGSWTLPTKTWINYWHSSRLHPKMTLAPFKGPAREHSRLPKECTLCFYQHLKIGPWPLSLHGGIGA